MENHWTEIITSLSKSSLNLIKLEIFGYDTFSPLSFLITFTNLQEIILSFHDTDLFMDFDKLQSGMAAEIILP